MKTNNAIIFFTKYSEKGPSSRYRSYQYISYIKNEFELQFYPLFSDDYIDNLYSNKGPNFLKIIIAYFTRIFQVLKFLGTGKIIFIEYELLPYFPPILEYLLKKSGVKVIIDFDDAIFHNYEFHKIPLVRYFFRNKIYRIVKISDLIITGSPYLTSCLSKYNDCIIEIPTSVNLNLYIKDNIKNIKDDRFIIGWIGSKTTSWNLIEIKDVINRIITENPRVIFKFCGFDMNLSHHFNSENIQFIDWSEENEFTFLNSLSLGLMPLGDTLFNQGKCGFKLIQYMACGIPTISTPLQANVKINRGNNNLFANDNNEWYEKMNYFINNIELFKKTGYENIETVRKYYSTENNSKLLISIISKLID
jgi:glycosyltransferase involved in cell wall biosynthesis